LKVGLRLGSHEGISLGFAVGFLLGVPVGFIEGAIVGGLMMETLFTPDIVIVNPSRSIFSTMFERPVWAKVVELASAEMLAACAGVRFCTMKSTV
jgi:hypothetical protein